MSDISFNETDLKKLKVEQLKVLCREGGLKVSGKKQELVDRLLGKTEPVVKKKVKVAPVIKDLVGKIPTIITHKKGDFVIVKCEGENFVGELIVRTDAGEPFVDAILDDEKRVELTIEAIEYCKEKRIPFRV